MLSTRTAHALPVALSVLLAWSGLAAGDPVDADPVAARPGPAAAPALVADDGRGVEGSGKGVSLWAAPGVDAGLADSGATWFWNWDTDPGEVAVPPGVQFVPTLWGSGSVTPERLAQAEASGSEDLLTFNEPDHTDQADLSVEDALALWPQVEQTGLRLGSPAVAEHGATPGGWLDRFMEGAADQGFQVDFIALHWYGSDFRPWAATRSLREYVRAVHRRYRLPVWVTEFALIGYEGGVSFPTPRVQARFLKRATAMLDRLPFVERYAWFSLPAEGQWAATGLYDTDGVPTPAGRAFRAAP